MKHITALKEKANEEMKKGAALMFPVLATGTLTITSFAEEVVPSAEGSTDVIQATIDAMTTSLTSIAGSVGTMIGSVLPIIIPIAGVGIVVSIGFAIVKKITRNA